MGSIRIEYWINEKVLAERRREFVPRQGDMVTINTISDPVMKMYKVIQVVWDETRESDHDSGDYVRIFLMAIA